MTEQIFHRVADAADVPLDSVKTVTLDGLSILLVHTEDGLFAIENRCSHAQEPLACGRIKYGWIACPAHGARFDLETGEALTAPATSPVRIFPIRIEDGRISIAIG